MIAPTIYFAHPTTRIFIGTALADADPLDEGNWLMPAHAYLEAPPDVPEGQAARRTVDGSAWELADDNRGPIYSTATGGEIQLLELGPVPDGYTRSPRPSLYHVWSQEGCWVLDEAAQTIALATVARQTRDESLREAALRIAPLQDAVDMGLATPEDAQALLDWKRFRVALSRIEQQAGFPRSIDWPINPAPVQGTSQ